MSEGIKFVITADDTNFQQALERVRRASDLFASDMQSRSRLIHESFGQITKGAISLLKEPALAAEQFVSEIVRVRSQIEAMQAPLEVLTGSQQRGAALMRELQQMATTSPLSLDGLAQALQTLLSLNVQADTAMTILTQLADISAADTDRFLSLAQAFAQASSSGHLMQQHLEQMIQAGFDPLAEMSRTSGRSLSELTQSMNEGAISIEMLEGAFASATSEGGKFHGMLEAQSQTLHGASAQLSAAIDDMYNKIGESNQDLIVDGYRLATSLVQNYEVIGDAIMGLVSIVGIHKAAIIAHNAVQVGAERLNAIVQAQAQAAALEQVTSAQIKETLTKQGLTAGTYAYNLALKQEVAAELESLKAKLAKQRVGTSLLLSSEAQALLTKKATLEQALETAAVNANTASKSLNAKITTVLSGAVAQLNAAIASNAWSIGLVAVTALAYGLYKLTTQASAAEVAQQKLNDALDNYKKHQDETSRAIDQHIATIKNENETIYRKIKSYEALKTLIPELTNEYSLQELATLDLANAERIRNEKRDENDKKHLESLLEKYELAKKYGLYLISLQNYSIDGYAPVNKVDFELYSPKGKQAYKELDFGFFTTTPGNVERIEELIKQTQNKISEIERLKKQAQEASKDPITLKIEAQAKYEQLKQNLLEAERKLEEEIKRFGNPWLVPIQLRLEVQNARDALNKQNSIIDSIVPTSEAAKKTVEARVRELEQTVKSKTQELSKLRQNGSVANTESIRKIQGELKAAQDELEVFRPKYNGKTKAELAREANELNKLREQHDRETKRQRIDFTHSLEELEISLMQEGEAKTLAQLDHKHEKELEALRRSQEDYLEAKRESAERLFDKDPKNRNKVFDRSSVSLAPEEEALFQKKRTYIESRQAVERKAYEAEEQRAMQQYLAEYGAYQEKRLAIAELYEQKIAQAKTEGERLSLGKERDSKIASLDAEANKNTEAIGRIFGNMTEQTAKDMRALANEAREALDYISEGVYKTDSEGKPLFGITPERLNQLKGNGTEIEKINKQIKAIEQSANQAEGPLKQLAHGLQELFKNKPGSDEANKGLELMRQGFAKVEGPVNLLSGAFGALSSITGSGVFSNISGGLNEVMNVAGSVMQGFASGGPVGGIIAGVSAISGAISKAADAGHEERIKAMQKNVDSLKKKYDQLGKAIDKAFSSEAAQLYEKQNQNLESQIRIKRMQYREESAKKNADPSKKQAYLDEINNLKNQQKENQEKAVDAIFGQNIKNAISDFANAYAEAWKSGENRSESAKEQARKMMRSMILEQIKSLTSPDMQRLRDKMKLFFADNVFTETEAKELERISQEIQQKTDEYAKRGANARLLTGVDAQGATPEASRGAWKSMTQETANELNGRFTAIQQSVLGIAGVMNDLRSIGAFSMGYLEDISKSNRELYRISTRLDDIELNTRGLR